MLRCIVVGLDGCEYELLPPDSTLLGRGVLEGGAIVGLSARARATAPGETVTPPPPPLPV